MTFCFSFGYFSVFTCLGVNKALETYHSDPNVAHKNLIFFNLLYKGVNIRQRNNNFTLSSKIGL